MSSLVADKKTSTEPSNFQNAPINANLKPEQKLEFLNTMLRIRRFEERCVKSYQQGNIGGFCHTYIGQEAVAVGTTSLMGADDHIISGYRIHGLAMSIGMDPNELMAEMYGKVTGCSKGKGGSMHFLDVERRFWGGHGIVGGHTPLGAGLAFVVKYQGKQGSCMCYLGDGAVNQGVLYESLNLAGLWDLPVIYIIENNQFSMGTSQERSSAGKPLAKRAEGFGIEWAEVQGNDVYEVRAKTHEALERAHKENRPTMLEIHTYRYRGHSMSDPDQTYRTKDDIKAYRESSDPIDKFYSQLQSEGVISEDQFKEIDDKAKAEANEAADFAANSDYPDPKEIMDDVYFETDKPNERTSQGTIFFNQIEE